MSSRMASFLSEHTMADVKILKPNAYNPPVYDFGENISDHSLLVSRAHKQVMRLPFDLLHWDWSFSLDFCDAHELFVSVSTKP